MTKTKKENNARYKILVLSITAVLVISLLAITSYAKYITTINADGRAQVGKWSFKVNESDNNNIGEINLGRKSYTAETIADGEIAPGTSGEFTIKVDATGTKTGVNYTVGFSNIQNKPTNLYFKVGNTKYYDFDNLSTSLAGIIDANDPQKVKEINICWAWDYETGADNEISKNDEIDTADGKTANLFSFDIAVTGTQVMPT